MEYKSPYARWRKPFFSFLALEFLLINMEIIFTASKSAITHLQWPYRFDIFMSLLPPCIIAASLPTAIILPVV
jgi:hypothetical protein